jgi:short-subunit dehydrogenase
MPAAIVTGASVGIGRAFAQILAREKFDLVLVARSQAQLDALAAELRQSTGRTILTVSQDLSEPGAAEKVFGEVSRSGLEIDALINNAGFGALGRFWEVDRQQQWQMIQVNIAALTSLTRLFLPSMIERRRGRILNVASTAAFQPGPLMAVYYASKAYVVSFSQAVHNEARPFGVTVTCLCPGPTKTEFAQRAGMSATKLFAGPMSMSAERVAQIGYRAMMRGKPLVIAGRLNALGAFLTRFAPMRLTAALARRMQET